MNNPREFNSIKINGDKVTKGSTWKDKILGEVNWFKSVPKSFEGFVPKVYKDLEDKHHHSYDMELIEGFPLNWLMVGDKLDSHQWMNIFYQLNEFLELCSSYEFGHINVYDLYVKKTVSRLHDFGIQLDQKFTINGNSLPPIGDIVNHCYRIIGENKTSSIIHGDLCFSNIIHSGNGIKMIDPRGLDANGRLSITGDLTYDYGKIAHSVIGKYDFIMSGKYMVLRNGNDYDLCVETHVRHSDLIKLFKDSKLFSLNSYPVMVLLFLSMPPLHSEDSNRQQALFANGLQLYNEMIKNYV